MHQQQHCISSSNASAHQQHQPISSISVSAASAHQQHQCISSISASVTSEKISAHIHQVRSYQPLSIKTTRHAPDTTRHAPDTTRHAPDTTRHHQTWSKHHQIPQDMHHVWFVWSKTSYSGDKWRCHRCGTDGRTIADCPAMSFVFSVDK